MQTSRFRAIGVIFAAFLGVAAGPCSSTATFVCPTGSVDDGTGTGTCISNQQPATLGIAPPLGTAGSSFYYMGPNPLGFVLGNGASFSYNTNSNQIFIPEVNASFGKGPVPSDATKVGQITEVFTAVAVYNATQGLNAGIDPFDTFTSAFSNSGLTGFVVAVGYALTTSGYVVPLIARFTPHGFLDSTFNNGTGYLLLAPGEFTGGAFSIFTSVAIDSVGRIVVGGLANALPSITNTTTGKGYLYELYGKSTSANGALNPNNLDITGDELVGVVARYNPDGSVDTSFDAHTLQNFTVGGGSATDGFATSPCASSTACGFANKASFGSRRDFVMGVAVDDYNGILAVGGSAKSFSSTNEWAFVAHYSVGGLLDSVMLGSAGTASAPPYTGTLSSFGGGNGTEYFSGIAPGPDNYFNVAGTTQTAGNKGLVARYTINNVGITSGSTTESLAFDPGFATGTTGFLVLPALNTQDTLTSVAYDPSGYLVCAGRTNDRGILGKINILNGANTYQRQGPAATGYAGSSNDTFAGVAVLSKNGKTHYMTVGSSVSATGTDSLIASYKSTSFAEDIGTTDAYTLPTGTTLNFPLPLPPASYLSSPPVANTPSGGSQVQIGPHILNGSSPAYPGASFGTAYGGGMIEGFKAIAASPSGENAIVVGFTTDFAITGGPLTGRAFPIMLLIYGGDSSWSSGAGSLPYGAFPNMANYADFDSLQWAF